MHRFNHLTVAAVAVAAFLGGNAQALEYPLGAPQQLYGMEVGGVYLQPIEMEPAGMMRSTHDSDVHLETDVHAMANNPNGFDEGAWMPYLQISYELTKEGTTWKNSGTLMPMVASDGPHYGDNVKLNGPGRYHVKFTYYAPNAPENANGHHFGRHTDRLTGVRPWFHPFSAEWDFTFAGLGKRGGY